MIRSHFTEKELLDAIARVVGKRKGSRATSWISRAAARTKVSVKARSFVKAKSEFWGELKATLLELQHNKCAYCERRLASADVGSIESDVEHYRPKSQCNEWASSTLKPSPKRGRAGGYYWLAYAPLNYAVSCKTCNSPLKGDRFPVDGVAARSGGSSFDSAALKSLNEKEKPLLLFSVGPLADDPKEYLSFIGVVLVPKNARGQRQRRAAATIEFFRLSDPKREELFRERAERIVAADNAARVHDAASRRDRPALKRDLDAMILPSATMSACVADYLSLRAKSPAKARELAEHSRELLAGDRAILELATPRRGRSP